MLKCGVSLFVISVLHFLGVIDFRLDCQHLVNAVCGGCSTRKHDKHHRKHQEREKNLNGVLKKGDERTDLHIAIVDTDSAEPEYSDRCQVEYEHHHWHHKRHDTVDFDGHVSQIAIGKVE